MISNTPGYISNQPEEKAWQLFFEELFKKHESMLYALARRLTKSD